MKPELVDIEIMRDKRNEVIVSDFAAGDALKDIAEKHGISPQRVGQIVSRFGIERDFGRRSKKIRNIPNRRGRPKLPITESDQKHYAKLRRILGARYARQAMGIPL